MFISAAYGGRASDTGGVEEYFCPGNTIMANRGFILDLHFEVQKTSMNVPAFTKGGLLHYLSAMLPGTQKTSEKYRTKTSLVRVRLPRQGGWLP